MSATMRRTSGSALLAFSTVKMVTSGSVSVISPLYRIVSGTIPCLNEIYRAVECKGPVRIDRGLDQRQRRPRCIGLPRGDGAGFLVSHAQCERAVVEGNQARRESAPRRMA